MRFWFKDGVVEEQLAALKKDEYLGGPKQVVKTCRFSGKKYMDTYMDFLNPTTEVPNASLAELIEKITVKDHRISRGFRTDGVYHYDGAVLSAEIHESIRFSLNMFDRTEREMWQGISITAPNVEALRAIYSQFRQGLLKPTKDYEANSRANPSEPSEPLESEPEKPTTATQLKKEGSGYGWEY